MSLELARERLREWAFYFKDGVQRRRAGSAEGAWRSPQVWQTVKARPPFDELRAVETWRLLQSLPVESHRVLTVRYCWSRVPQGAALRVLSRRLGRRISAADFDNLVYAGERQVAILLATRRV